MKNKFNWAVALYIISFFLPVLEIPNGFYTEVIYGWEAAREILFTWDYGDNNVSDTDSWRAIHYVAANLANPLVIVTIILHYAKGNYARLKWTISLIAVISSLYWLPVFFGYTFDYFSFGYWTWLCSIILIHFFANDGSFKRPPKNA